MCGTIKTIPKENSTDYEQLAALYGAQFIKIGPRNSPLSAYPTTPQYTMKYDLGLMKMACGIRSPSGSLQLPSGISYCSLSDSLPLYPTQQVLSIKASQDTLIKKLYELAHISITNNSTVTHLQLKRLPVSKEGTVYKNE